MISEQDYEQAGLENRLHFWEQQEQKFEKLFGPDSIKSPEFLKMKLDHYDGLWYMYKNVQNEQDRLLVKMVAIQRRKMEDALYTATLSRLFRIIHKIVAGIQARNQQRIQPLNDQAEAYTYLNLQSPAVKEPLTVQQRQQPMDTAQKPPTETKIPPDNWVFKQTGKKRGLSHH